MTPSDLGSIVGRLVGLDFLDFQEESLDFMELERYAQERELLEAAEAQWP